jgi:16S rRNA (uracil1498-N3)-methyltransferase
MTLHHFFIDFDQAVRTDGELRIVDPTLAHQLQKVLRKRIGDQVIFLDNKGNEYLSEIRTLTLKFLIAKILNISKNKNEPKTKIILCPSLIKISRFEWLLEKGTEIGVSEFTPILTSRSEIKDFRKERALKIIKEAAEQSERGLIPKLNEPKFFKDILTETPKNEIFLDRSGIPISSVIDEFKNKQAVSIFVGPEGGWTIEEMNFIREKGIKIISLGSRVLRSETAAIAVCSILLSV